MGYCSQRCEEANDRLVELREEGRLTARSIRYEVMLNYPTGNSYTLYDTLIVPKTDLFRSHQVYFGTVNDFGNPEAKA